MTEIRFLEIFLAGKGIELLGRIMGHVMVSVKLTNPITGKEVIAQALIDTGATLSVIPRSIANDLGLASIGKRRVRTASGEEVLEESYLIIELEGERTASPVLISDKLDRVLIGVITLEALALEVDPRSGRLRKTELLLL